MIQSRLRGLLKTAAYRGGLLGGYHLIRNRKNLTVAMFHRVLAQDDPEWATADPNWTVSLPVFRDCLQFFRKHYNVIGIDELIAAQDTASLPSRPLLITLDDGWADNCDYALDVLREVQVPATVFVVAEAALTGRIWDQSLYEVWRKGWLGQSEWRAILEGVEGAVIPSGDELRSSGAIRNLLTTLSGISATERTIRLQRVSHLESRVPTPRVLNPNQIRQLHQEGVTIGSHGLTHALVPYTEDPDVELAVSKRILSELLGNVDINAVSFPHGACDERTVEGAVRLGYRALFDSRPFLNRIPRTFKAKGVLARINICESNITRRNGRLAPAKLAYILFSSPVCSV